MGTSMGQGSPERPALILTHKAKLVHWFGPRCLACGLEFQEHRPGRAGGPWVGLTVDHVVPSSLGGPDALSNLQLLCKPCNGAKGATIVDYRDPAITAAMLAAHQVNRPA